MKRYAGIWIDHEKAFVVEITDDHEEIIVIKSNVEGRIRLSGGSRSRTIYGPQDVASESKAENRRKHQLHKYYNEVIQAVINAEKILIFGPGEAKIELEKELKKSKNLSAMVAGIETADKMTERQIAAKVRDFFLHHKNSI